MPETNRPRPLAVAQMLVSGLGLLGTVTAIPGMLALGMLQVAKTKLNSPDAQPFFTLAWVSGLLFVLLLTPFWMAAAEVFGLRPPSGRWKYALPASSGLLLLLPLFYLAGGRLAGQDGAAATLLLPPLQMVAAAAPLWWLLEAGQARLGAPVSPRRTWGALSFSMVLTEPLIIALEVAGGALLFIAVTVVVVVGVGPEKIQAYLQGLTVSLQNEAAVTALLRSWLQNPLVLFGVGVNFCVLVPLLEELFKPLALWVLARRGLHPREGFVLGMVCGGAFALLESLGVLVSPLGDQWTSVAVGRIGTGVMHVTTCGLLGMALARYWKEGGALRLGLTYLACAGLHGVWNFFALFGGLAELAEWAKTWPPAASIAPYGLTGMIALLLLVLLGTRRAADAFPESGYN